MSDQEASESGGSSVDQGVDSGEESLNNPPLKPVVKQQKPFVVERQDNDITCATYIFNNEDHTLGNPLRMVLARDPNVEFVGYSIPHPSQTKMNLRLQTTGADSNQVINEGLRNLEVVARIIRKKFEKALFASK